MSAMPDGVNGAAEPARLGTVLIQRGLLTEEQLETALAEQGRTGRPLGETLVALGFVPGPVIGQALATQRGGLLKTEYGFATGFRPEGAAAVEPIAPPPPPATHETAPPPRLVTSNSQSEELRQQRLRVQQSEQEATKAREQAEAERATSAELNERIATLQQKLDEAFEQLAQLGACREELAIASSARDAALAKLAEAEAKLAQFAEVEGKLSRLDEAEAKLAQLAEVDAKLEERTQRCTQLEAELAELRANPPAAPVQQPEPVVEPEETRFTVFVRTPEGYRLFELDGKAPAVGSRVELPGELGGGVREVLSMARSPLPDSDLRCVHLI